MITKATRNIKQALHTGIRVRNMEESLAWYEMNLGFVKVKDDGYVPPLGAHIMFIDGTWPPVMHNDLQRYVYSDCWTSDEDIQVYLNLIAYGKLDITPLISHEFRYKDIGKAYAEHVFPKIDPKMSGGVICWE